LFFDEIWELIKYSNPDYFIGIFKTKRSNDERDRIQKYFTYFIAKFHLENEDYELAIQEFEKTLKDENLNAKTEKLLIARIHEVLSIAYDEKENEASAKENLLAFYQNFPQLFPYSKHTMKMNFVVENNSLTEEQKTIIEELKDCNIDWVTKGITWPTLKVSFVEKDKKQLINYQVLLENKTMFDGVLDLKDIKNPGQKIVFRAFGIYLK